MSKIKVTEAPSTNTEYPCIKISLETRQIILFTGPRKGVNINGVGSDLGYFCADWIEEDFGKYYGSVTLEND